LRDVLAVSHYLSGELLREKGLLLRGAVTLGKVYESPNVLFGPALVEAHDLEKAARYPRIILSNEVATSGDIEWMDKGANPTRCFTFCTIDGTTYLDSLRTFCTWIGTGDTPAYMTSEEWMRRWREVAEAGVAKYVAEPRVREKYEWMIEEHERVFALGERGDPTGY